MIAILTAMDVELENILSRLEDVKEVRRQPGALWGDPVHFRPGQRRGLWGL